MSYKPKTNSYLVTFTLSVLCFFPLLNVIADEIESKEILQKIQQNLPAENEIKEHELAESIHQVDMRIFGSMCLACLNDLSKRMQKIIGIIKVKVKPKQISYSEPYSPSLLNWAQTTIVYDETLISLAAIKNYLNDFGYNPYKIKDKTLDSYQK